LGIEYITTKKKILALLAFLFDRRDSMVILTRIYN